jgi:2-methylisocitrate lyase-like PEP mutase family enzyme
MVAKVRAAARARDELEEDIVIFARTDVGFKARAAHETMEDAVVRVNTYLDAGADGAVLFPPNEEDARYVTEHVDGPVKFAAVESNEFCPSMDTLEDIGFAAANTPTSALVAATRAVRNLYESFYETGTLTTLQALDVRQTKANIEETIDFAGLASLEHSHNEDEG